MLQSAIGRADQVVLVTTPESVASTAVFTALRHLHQERTIVVANKFHARRAADLRELERRLRERRMPRPIAIPYDDQLAAMLDTATYHLDALERTSRIATQTPRRGSRRAARLMRTQTRSGAREALQ